MTSTITRTEVEALLKDQQTRASGSHTRAWKAVPTLIESLVNLARSAAEDCKDCGNQECEDDPTKRCDYWPTRDLAKVQLPGDELPPRCPRCGVGRDDDGDGNCAYCHNLTDKQLVERLF